MKNLFVTTYKNGFETELDKQHVGSFVFDFQVQEAMEEIATILFQEYKEVDMLVFQIDDKFFTKKRPETGAFANIPVPKEIHLRSELTNMNLRLVDNSKAKQVVDEIEAKEMTIKQWAKNNSKQVQSI